MSRVRPRHAHKGAGRTVKGGLPLRRAGISALAVAAVAGAGLTGLAAQAEPETGKNLLSNGSFSTSNAGWTGGKNTRLSSADGRSDDRALRVTSTSHSASTVALKERRTPVENVLAKHTYRATAWVRVEKLGRSIALRLHEKADNAHVLGTEQSASKPADTGWKKITTSYTARHDSSSLDLSILGYGLDRDRGIVIDDVMLVDVTPAASTARPTATASAKPKASETPSAKPTTKQTAKSTEAPKTSSPTPAASTKPTASAKPAAAKPTAETTARPATSAPSVGKPAASSAPSGWKLAWKDEFNGTSIDRNAWTVEDNSTYGDGNDELACLMDRPENIKESDGVLTIAARKESSPVTCGSHDSRFPNGRSYTSAMMNTKNKVDFEYGRFEMRAKMPTVPGSSKGLWPGFWMRPVDGGVGELDMVEIIGTAKNEKSDAGDVHQSIHYDYVGTHPMQTYTYSTPNGTFADDFHDFAVEWEPGSIKWYVDGALTYTRDTSTTSWLTKSFSRQFYLRLNMAVGGSWPGTPDADTAFPANFKVDYVRVYQR